MKFNARSWKNKNGVSDKSSVIVSCGDIKQTIALADDAADYTVVLTGCSDSSIKLAGTGAKSRFYISNVEIYNGDLTAAPMLRNVVEEGDSTWRTVSGIPTEQYTVQALGEGLYKYMVKAVYLDGTESVWSNIKYVTLTGEGDDLLIGDVNNDGLVNITDVTLLIGYVLNDEGGIVIENADLNNDGDINITDVTLLISQVLNDSE